MTQVIRGADEEETEDIITALPRNVVDRILELLPVHDAARTSILSKKWRNIWVSLPYLVLNNYFCNKLTAKSLFVFRKTVDEILLQHIGHIVKFVLDVSRLHLSFSANINRWIRYVSRNGVKELTLNVTDNRTYKLPSYIFNCPTLTRLELFNCVFKPPNSFVGFKNVTFLNLEAITFVPPIQFCVINVPLLVHLTLKCCHGTQYLKIVSPQLESLVVHECHYLVLNCFMNCKKLRFLEFEKVVDNNPKRDEISTLEKFLFSFTSLETLSLGSVALELLNAYIVQLLVDGLPSKMNCLWHLQLDVDFSKVDQTSCALQLIKSLPNLSKLHISVQGSHGETIMKYLETATWLDRPLKKLEYVAISSFKCSKAELLFVKLLCARTPSLVRMCIDQGIAIDSKEERKITIKLMRFPRASPRAELFYYPFEATNED